MTSSDKDFRFMATNDLMTELQKDSIKVSRYKFMAYYTKENDNIYVHRIRFSLNKFIYLLLQLDDDSERKVVKMLLRLLEDKNGEVQNLAVRW